MKPSILIGVVVVVLALSLAAVGYGIFGSEENILVKTELGEGVSLDVDGKTVDTNKDVSIGKCDGTLCLSVNTPENRDVLLRVYWADGTCINQLVHSTETGKELKFDVPSGCDRETVHAEVYYMADASYTTDITFHFDESVLTVSDRYGEIHDGDVVKINHDRNFTAVTKNGKTYDLALGGSWHDDYGTKGGYSATAYGSSIQGHLEWIAWFGTAVGDMQITAKNPVEN